MRVTRYTANPALDPHENRLTEVTASVLDHVGGLAHELATYVLGVAVCEMAAKVAADGEHPPEAVAELARRQRVLACAEALKDGRATVRTQVTTRSCHFVDLEVHLRPPVGVEQPDVLVWVEVKHGADLHHQQLETYVADIDQLADEPVVVLLAPRDEMPSAGKVPLEVPSVTWQGVAQLVKDSAEVRRPEHAWLLDQYATYLKENDLMDPDALTTVHALALMEIDGAVRAVEALCEHTVEYVDKNWSKRVGQQIRQGKPAYGQKYWATYPKTKPGHEKPASWRGGYFEWSMREAKGADQLESPRGAWFFMAGATLPSGPENPTRVDGNAEWFSRRRADSFVHFWVDRWRLMRLRYPDELLNQTTLEAQGVELGTWVVQAFEDLANDPPLV